MADSDGCADRARARDLEDAAAVLAVLTALAAAGAGSGVEPVAPRSFWNDPAFRLADAGPGPHAWWASGLPR